MPNNSRKSVEEESKDLSTCCVCLESYDELLRKPKFLPCYHSYCLQCIKAMVPPPANQLTCPKCKRDTTLCQQEAENLTTNAYALNIVQLKKLSKNQHFWCLECGAIPIETCEGRHAILDRMEDVKAIMALLTYVSGTFSEATERRQQIKEVLQAATAANDEGLHQLRSLAEKEQLSPTSKTGASSAIKKLEETLKQAKEEAEKSNKMWNDLTGNGKDLEQSFSCSGAKKRKMGNGGVDEEGPSTGDLSRPTTNSSYKVPLIGGNCAKRLPSMQLLKCRDLIGQHSRRGVNAVEFSDDGSLFVSGGDDGRVLLWPTNQAIDEEWTLSPTAMETKHNHFIWCLAVSPDNKRFFSGGWDNQVLIHDVDTRKMLRSFPHPSDVRSIAVQPETNGNIIATACGDGIFRIFDTRCNDVVAESEKNESRLNTVRFSPADSNILAVAGYIFDVLFYDIRRPTRYAYSLLPSRSPHQSIGGARFNTSGTRLLCHPLTRPPFHSAVYILPNGHQQQQPSDLKKIMLMAPGFSHKDVLGHQAFCFAGIDDELAISASDDHKLFIWSLPSEADHRNQTVGQSIKILRGHGKKINCVRYNKEQSTIVSCANDGVIKLWTPMKPGRL